MKTNVNNFIGFVTERSKDNIVSILALHHHKIYGTCTAILSQEFDLLMRVCYLHSLSDKQAMESFMNDMINGSEWQKNGKKITGKEMANIAGEKNKWVREIYDFCNSLTLMTNLYYYKYNGVLQDTAASEQSIRHYLKSYHHFALTMEFTYENIVFYIPKVAEKLAGELKSYLQALEQE